MLKALLECGFITARAMLDLNLNVYGKHFMKKLLIIFLLIPIIAISGTFKDEEGKFGLKT